MTQTIDLVMFMIWTRLPLLRIINNLVFRISRGTSTLEILLIKILLLTKKIRCISNLNIIVIGGCPRSGTTLARALIGMHQKIACPQQECYFLMNIKNPAILKETFDFSLEEINKLGGKYEDIVSFAENVLRLYMQKEGKQLVALKAPIYVTIIDELFHHFPNMKFIHVLRDGRDAACSLRTFPKRKIANGEIVPINIRNPFDWGIRLWVSCVNRGRKWMKSDRYIEVKYEDLVNDSVNTVKRIFDFLGVEMPDKNQLLSFYKYEKGERHPQNIEVGRPIYKTAIGRMKTDMSENEKEMFKYLAGEMLMELGYEKDLDW
ncbi:MAG: sulfotransferase [Thermoplasmatales archaeon]|nr:MAG: sulfotransferase [Thermoplasmatales archaeon]